MSSVPALVENNAPAVSEQTPTVPYNLEAEQALLGAILFDNEALFRAGDQIKSEHFYDPVHEKIFDISARLIRQGRVAEPIVIKDRLSDDPGFQEVGELQYLAFLVASAPPAHNAPEYAQLIYDLALRRELINISAEVVEKAKDRDGTHDAHDVIEFTERQLFALAESGQANAGFSTFATALTESMETLAAAYERDGGLAGISTGLTDMDQRLGGLHPSDLLILAGRPSMGKTALATNIAFNIAKAYQYEIGPDGERKTTAGGVVAFYSLEMSAEQLAGRLIAEYSGVPSDKIRRGAVTAEEYGHIRDASMEIQNCPLFIDDTGGLSIAHLAARARRLKRMHGLDLIVVDYLQLVTPADARASQGRVQEVSEITMSLKALAKELNVPIIALSQLSRQVESREDKRPQLSDLRESGSIEQDADAVMFVYREAYYKGRMEPREGTPEHLTWQDEMDLVRNMAEVIIGKQRHGPIGTVKLGFDENITKFTNLAQDGRYQP